MLCDVINWNWRLSYIICYVMFMLCRYQWGARWHLKWSVSMGSQGHSPTQIRQIHVWRNNNYRNRTGTHCIFLFLCLFSVFVPWNQFTEWFNIMKLCWLLFFCLRWNLLDISIIISLYCTVVYCSVVYCSVLYCSVL